MRAGVPVFILPDVNPKLSNCEVIPLIAFSPILPPPNSFSPKCIEPFKKVPLFKTTALALISRPILVFTPLTLFFLTNTSSTTSCQKSRFSIFSSTLLQAALKSFLSHWALGLHIAGPLERFNNLYCIELMSVTKPV